MEDALQQERDHLGQRLRDAREYLGLSQEFVAQQLSIPRASVSAMETGKRKVSSIELKHLARLYKRPMAYFLGEEHSVRQDPGMDASMRTLFRTTQELNEQDREQVLRFAEFLRQAGRVPNVDGQS